MSPFSIRPGHADDRGRILAIAVAILAVAREAEGQGLGKLLLGAAEDWGQAQKFRRLTLSVFADNRRAREFYSRQGWRPELETYYKNLG